MLACTLPTCYHVHQSPRSGKLPATWTTLRNLLRCSHRSDEKDAVVSVSCVGRLRDGCRDVADMPRWLRGSGLRPADGKQERITSAYDSDSTAKNSGQRLPVTRPVMRHLACMAAGLNWASQTKDLRCGLTECAVFVAACYRQTHTDHISEGKQSQTDCMTGYGRGAHLLARSAFFQVAIAAVLIFCNWPSYRKAKA